MGPVRLGDAVDGGFDVGIEGDRDRPAHLFGVEAVKEVVAPEPRVGAHTQFADGAGAPGAGDGLDDEMLLAALGGPFAQPRVEYLAGVGAHPHEGVIAELLGVPVGGARLFLAGHFTDRRVHVNRHRFGAGTAAGRPRPPEHLTGGLVQLADVTPREGAQERPHRRRRRRAEPQHASGRARPQPVHVIDMGGAHQHRRHQRRHLAPRRRRRHAAPQAHRRVHHRHHTQPPQQRRRRQQTRISHQRLVIEDHLEPVNLARYSTHRKCLPIRAESRGYLRPFSQVREALPRIYTPQHPTPIGGSRLSRRTRAHRPNQRRTGALTTNWPTQRDLTR